MEQETETAEEHLKLQIAMLKDTGAKDSNALNGAVAKNVLHEELGRFKGQRSLLVYHLDDNARDRLLAHARQDAAHALCNTATLLDQMKSLRRAMLALIGLLMLASAAAITLSFH